MHEGPLVFCWLDGHEQAVLLTEIVRIERIHVDGPADRSRVHLRNRSKFTVPETPEQVFTAIQSAMNGVPA